VEGTVDMTGAINQLRSDDTALRQVALGRLKKRSDFWLHLMIYLMVNGFLVIIWAMTGMPFFWPVFPIFGWGIGVAANAWDAFLRREPTESELQHEVERLRAMNSAS
jgi:hypothetical protein